jgi:hypothetical protein
MHVGSCVKLRSAEVPDKKTQSLADDDLDLAAYANGGDDPELIRSVTHVGNFSYEAQTNFLGGWSEEKERRVVFLLQRTLQDALEGSGFHNLGLLETRRLRDGIEFEYRDLDYGFSFSLDGRGRINISRRRSSAENFHEWYRRFMPSLTHIVLRTIEVIDDELTGFDRDGSDRVFPTGKVIRPPVIQVERAAYNFQVVVEIELKESSRGRSLPNIQVLNRSLLSRVPSDAGALTDPLTVAPEEFGRIDYQVNRWSRLNQISENYRVAAPSHNRWKLLLFDFQYMGDTYVPSNGDRLPFNQKTFLTGAVTSDAYLVFFRQHCLSGFMKDVLFGDRGRLGLDDELKFVYSTPASW